MELTQPWVLALLPTQSGTSDWPLTITSMAPLSCDVASVTLSDFIPGALPTSHLSVPFLRAFLSISTIYQAHGSEPLCLLAPLLRPSPRRAKKDYNNLIQAGFCFLSFFFCQMSVGVKPLLLDGALWKHFNFQRFWMNYGERIVVLYYFPHSTDRKMRHGEVK